MENLEAYYRFQSLIYDATRWMFLFGRRESVAAVARLVPRAKHIVEIGCGTGRNLVPLARRIPSARITGVDLSPDMLAIARRKTSHFCQRITLQHRVQGDAVDPEYDVVVFSYSLSMMNPGWETVLRGALQGLVPGGLVVATDFHQSPFPFFKAHMVNHHVSMNAHLLPFLAANTKPEFQRIKHAYGGLWSYFVFAGRIPGA